MVAVNVVAIEAIHGRRGNVTSYTILPAGTWLPLLVLGCDNSVRHNSSSRVATSAVREAYKGVACQTSNDENAFRKL